MEKGPGEDPKDFLGKVMPSSSQLDEKEESSALRVCFALQNFRLNNKLEREPVKIRAHVVQKGCTDSQISYAKDLYLETKEVPQMKSLGRGIASIQEALPSDQDEFVGVICDRLLRGDRSERRFQVKGQLHQFYFRSTASGDEVVELIGSEKVEKTHRYKVQTNSIEKNFGFIKEKQKGELCSGQELSYSNEIYLAP